SRSFPDKENPALGTAFSRLSDDPSKVQSALESATNLARTLWVSYLSLGVYVAITVGAVTHLDLLRETPIQLPFLQVRLPLKEFFLIVPFLFFIVHLYLMINLKNLADQVNEFIRLLRTAEISP